MSRRYLLVFLVVAACCGGTGCEKRHSSSALVQVMVQPPQSAEAILDAALASEAGPFERKRIKNTDLFKITVSDPDPDRATREVERIVDGLRAKVDGDSGGAKIIVWEAASPGSR